MHLLSVCSERRLLCRFPIRNNRFRLLAIDGALLVHLGAMFVTGLKSVCSGTWALLAGLAITLLIVDEEAKWWWRRRERAAAV